MFSSVLLQNPDRRDSAFRRILVFSLPGQSQGRAIVLPPGLMLALALAGGGGGVSRMLKFLC